MCRRFNSGPTQFPIHSSRTRFFAPLSPARGLFRLPRLLGTAIRPFPLERSEAMLPDWSNDPVMRVISNARTPALPQASQQGESHVIFMSRFVQ